MGIGFDVLGNYGNFQEKKYGGFHDPNQFNFNTPASDIKFYPNSIVIRGPLNSADPTRRNGSPAANSTNLALDSYQFIDGLITDFDPTPGAYGGLQARVDNGSGNLFATNPSEFLGTSQMFKIGSGLKPEDVDCAVTLPSGYRKVFIDLEPTGNPLSPYRIKVDMLVGSNPTPVNIFNSLIYSNKPAPATLKVGFAASTGSGYFSTQEIRNVAVQVSSIEDSAKPLPPPLFREICIDEPLEVDFPFCVELPSSNTAFIQCIQLFDTNPGAGDNDFAADAYECGLSGYCAQRCNETFKRLDAIVGGVKVGEFIAELEDEVEVGKFNQATIRFVRTNPSFFGTVTAWYKIVDNFGLESDGTPITITINPLPVLISSGTKVDVTCDGQGDGEINGIVIGNLAPDPDKYQVQFLDENNNLITPVLVSEVVQANGYITATFDLKNINLGTYRVRVVNPSSESLGDICSDNFDDIVADDCEEEFVLHTLDLERGLPLELDPYVDEICEGEVFEVTPTLDAKYNPNNLPVPFQWYTDENRSQQLTNGTTVSIDGSTTTVAIAADGTLSLTGLEADGLNPKTYTFYVETLFRDNSASGAGNFCPYDGDVTTVATVTVFPELQTSTTVTPDWCRATAGQILVNAQGGNGQKTYNLYLAGNSTPVATQITNATTHTFTGLLPGTYEVEIFTQNPTCSELISPLVVEGPTVPLTLTAGSTSNAFCASPNGSLEFNLTGGNPTYTLALNGAPLTGATITGSTYTVSNLAAGPYIISATDSKGCIQSITMTVAGDPVSQFDATDDEICQGQTAQVSPQNINQSSSTPTFRWYYRDASNNYVQINSGNTVAGATFTIDASSNLSVSGLAPQATAYTYYLEVTGSKVCPQGYIPAQILVNPNPVLAPAVLTQVTCNGSSDGSISAQLTSGNLSDFEFGLTGSNGFSSGFLKNNGVFNGLAPATYVLTVRSAKGCESVQNGLVITEPPLLTATEVSKVDATCDEDNGNLRFSISGGTPLAAGGFNVQVNGAPLSSLSGVTINSPTDFTLSDLAPGTYAIQVTDLNNCKADLSVTIADTPVPQFDAQDEQICEGEPAVLTPIVVSNTIGATPIYSWSFPDPSNPTALIPINDGDVVGGITYDVTNGVLSITGLAFDSDPYSYFLTVSGDKVCPADPIEVEVEVRKVPVAVFEEKPVSCINGNDGEIRLISVDPSGPNTFTLLPAGTSNSTGTFTGLTAGNYTIRVQENGSPCFEEFQIEVTQPEPLALINLVQQDPTCGEINGNVRFEITGGVKDYQLTINSKPLTDFTFSLTGDTYEVRNLAPGAYSVVIRDANSCQLSLPNLFTLTNDDGFTVDLAPMEEEICVGQVAELLPVFNTALPVNPVLKWYKDSALSQPITSSATPASDGIIYQISTTTGALSLTGLSAGTFTYFLEISGPGICTVVKQGEVTVYPPITASIIAENIVCFGDSNGSLTVNPSGGNGAFEVSVNGSPFTTNLSYTNLPAGDYQIAIRNSISCTFTQTVSIASPTAPIGINSPTIERSSCDQNNGAIRDLQISGGWGGYTVIWRRGSATGPIVPGTLTEALNLAPGIYFLQIQDSEGCQASFDFEIEESSDPVYAVVPPINSCTGTPVEIRPVHIAPNPGLPPAAPTEVRWYSGANQSGLLQSGPDPGNPAIVYTIDDSDWLNPRLQIQGLPAGVYDYYFYVVCTGQEIKVDVSVFDTPAVSLETDPVTCFGDTNGKIRLLSGVLPSYTYQLNGGPILSQSALEALNLPAGNYNLVVATPAGCAQTINFILEGPSGPLAVSPLTKIDPGCGAPNGKLIFSLSGGYLPYTLDVIKDGVSQGTQTSSQTDFQLDGYRPGVYQIRITDREGCEVQTNTVTLVDGPSQILVSDEVICEGEVAKLLPDLDPAAPGATFQWYFDAAKTQPITSSATPAADGRIYQVNPSTGELSISNLPVSGTGFTYFVTASGPGVCPGFTGSGIVRVSALPVASVQVANEVCFGDGGSITVSASGGSGGYTYSLNGGTFVSNPIFQVPTGTYAVAVRTSEGCITTVSGIQVTGPSGSLGTSGFQQNNPSCDLDNGSISFNISGGYPPYSITYTRNGNAAGNLSLASPGTVTVNALGEGTYRFTISDSQGCILDVQNPVNLVEVPTVISIQDQVICAGETAQLTPSLPANISNPLYTWYFDAAGSNPIPSGTSGGVTFTPNSNGSLTIVGLSASATPYTYYIMASGVGICGLSPKPVKVTVNEIPTLRVSNPSVVCDPQGTVDLTDYIEGFNPGVYDYNVLSPSGSALQIGDLDAVAVSGDYRVSSSVKGKGCWNQPQRIRVIIADEELVADFQYEVDLGNGTLLTNAEVQIQEDVQFEDLSLGKAIIWNWDFGDGTQSSQQNPVHQYQKKGTYTVNLQAIDEFGCISEYQRIIQVFDDYIVMVPNAFTPDGLKNKFFRPYYRGIASMDFYIFNTWGELIYHATSLEDQGWDGTHLGKPAPNGNYVYRGVFTSRSGEKVEKAGTFILIR